MTLTVEHIDPRRGVLISGLENDLNEIVADHSYNSRKTNRFVPYRICDYLAPVTFGDMGEFLIEETWVVCEFGGELWWKESNRVGNATTKGGEVAIKGMPREILVENGRKTANLHLSHHHPNTIASRSKSGTKNAPVMNAHKNTKASRERNLAAAQLHPNTRDNQIKQSLRKFQCLVTGHTSNAGGLTTYQRARGINTDLRVELWDYNNSQLGAK